MEPSEKLSISLHITRQTCVDIAVTMGGMNTSAHSSYIVMIFIYVTVCYYFVINIHRVRYRVIWAMGVIWATWILHIFVIIRCC